MTGNPISHDLEKLKNPETDMQGINHGNFKSENLQLLHNQY